MLSLWPEGPILYSTQELFGDVLISVSCMWGCKLASVLEGRTPGTPGFLLLIPKFARKWTVAVLREWHCTARRCRALAYRFKLLFPN